MTKKIKVQAGAGGRDSMDFARMLREMYAAWDGPVDGEEGVHRLVRISPFDDEQRRHTSFAVVSVDGDSGPVYDPENPGATHVRSYFLDPTERVKDHRSGRETDRARDVLAGDLSLIREDSP